MLHKSVTSASEVVRGLFLGCILRVFSIFFQAFLSEPLGVAGIIVTSDDQVVFSRRNDWVAESAGMLDVPGGHPEPTVGRLMM